MRRSMETRNAEHRCVKWQCGLMSKIILSVVMLQHEMNNGGSLIKALFVRLRGSREGDKCQGAEQAPAKSPYRRAEVFMHETVTLLENAKEQFI